MGHKNILSILLVICVSLETISALTVDTEKHPQVGDWTAATNNDGLVKIPLQNPRGHAWFLSLQMGTPLQYEQVCVVNNNHALSTVFSKYCTNCPHKVYDKTKSSTFERHYVTSTVVQSDGFTVAGGPCSDYMCIGQYGSKASIYKDPRTTVCMDDQVFFLVGQQLDWNWSAKATDVKYIDSVCGLGKEKLSPYPEGWIARAVHEGHI